MRGFVRVEDHAFAHHVPLVVFQFYDVERGCRWFLRVEDEREPIRSSVRQLPRRWKHAGCPEIFRCVARNGAVNQIDEGADDGRFGPGAVSTGPVWAGDY